jgi:hypothetical protein
VQRDDEIYRHAIAGERVGEADDSVVLLSVTPLAVLGLSNARIARCGSPGDVG